jgi:hypothetical protein
MHTDVKHSQDRRLNNEAHTLVLTKERLQGRWIPYAEIGKLEMIKEKELLRRVRGTIFFEKDMLPNSVKTGFKEAAETLVSLICITYTYDYLDIP